MLLLYLTPTFNNVLGINRFTFHYASTLSGEAQGYDKICPYLHSTMLLLYPESVRVIDHDGIDIYIPLCFYFIASRSGWFPQRYSIYIPLCFYFIRPVHTKEAQEKVHLHSTMLLLYPRKTNPDKPCKILIYIPLCFYFIAGVNDLINSGINIYIPLCFYFIPVSSSSIQHSKHIYIPLCFYFIQPLQPLPRSTDTHLHSTMLLLYPNPAFSFCCRSTHLHSTMLLLYPFFARTFVLFFKNLHSTMLLLYHCRKLLIDCVLHHLHSTMLLLYQDTGITKSTFSDIYIPLCFYFIHYRRLKREADIRYLHSTMLLLYLSDSWRFICSLDHLHSTMLLLYPVPVTCPTFTVSLNLHSTMLLLYPEKPDSIRSGTIYLHSTMLLLYRKNLSCMGISGIIYIPLCFYFIRIRQYIECQSNYNLHSTMLLLYPHCCTVVQRIDVNIYIPLCFYFIPGSLLLRSCLSIPFTFHYASTLSV